MRKEQKWVLQGFSKEVGFKGHLVRIVSLSIYSQDMYRQEILSLKCGDGVS